jgi:dephospho-CoA kinase
VYTTDEAAKRLTWEQHLLGDMSEERLTKIIFGEASEEKAKIEAVIHQAVFNDLKEWQKAREKEGHELCVVESALLPVDAAPYEGIWGYVLVAAPEPLRVKRVIRKTGLTEEEVQRRMACQSTEEEKRKQTKYEICNDGWETLEPQVEAFLAWIKTVN